MRIILLGRGRMGGEVARLAREAGHEIVVELDRTSRLGEGPMPDELRRADVAIDFTSPDAVHDNVKRLAETGLPVVVGTTGWDERLDDVRRIVAASGTGLVYGANFSIGANILVSLVGQAARLFERFAEYDPYVFEHHHKHKSDAPSGTALRLASTIVQTLSRKEVVETGAPAAPIDEKSLHVVGIRAGSVFGQHVVGFDSLTDCLEIAHVAKNREGFARGALFAAEWICSKQGVFEFHELFEGRLS